MKAERQKNLLLWSLGVLLGMGLGVLALVLFSWGLFWVMHSMDNTVPQEDELSRYPDMEVFLSGRTTFRGINHNLDLGEYIFAFKTSHRSQDEYFREVDGKAIEAGWIRDASSTNQRRYKRINRSYPAATGYEEVTLGFDPATSEIVFTWK